MASSMEDITELVEVGDKIEVEYYSNPLTVTDVLDSVGIVELEGSRGGSKSLVQNKNNPENVALMAGADKKGYVSDIIVVSESTEDDEDDDVEDINTDTHKRSDGRPKKTGAELFDSIARVRVDDTQVDNDTVRVTVEHPDHAGGVHSWLRYTPENVAASIRNHIQNMINTDVTRIDMVDDAGLGLSEMELMDTQNDVVPVGEVAQ